MVRPVLAEVRAASRICMTIMLVSREVRSPCGFDFAVEDGGEVGE